MRRRGYAFRSERRSALAAGDRAMSDATLKSARIRELNDQLRCKGIGGRVLITRGIEALGPDGGRDVLTAVARFNDFSQDNDPSAEHDCALLTVTRHRVVFQID